MQIVKMISIATTSSMTYCRLTKLTAAAALLLKHLPGRALLRRVLREEFIAAEHDVDGVAGYVAGVHKRRGDRGGPRQQIRLDQRKRELRRAHEILRKHWRARKVPAGGAVVQQNRECARGAADDPDPFEVRIELDL